MAESSLYCLKARSGRSNQEHWENSRLAGLDFWPRGPVFSHGTGFNDG